MYMGRTQSAFGAWRSSVGSRAGCRSGQPVTTTGATPTLPDRCTVVSFGESEAHEAGRLLGKTRTADVVDAVVVTTALRLKALILTGDEHDIKRLVAASGRNLVVLPV